MSTQLYERAQPIEILIVDDDDDDVRLTTKALAKDRICNNINRVEDGVEALAFLRREEGYADAVRPDLILLDLNMPKKNGREVLKEIKEDPDLCEIPVVVLTTSDDISDISASYKQQANCFVTKPVGMKQIRGILATLSNYWFAVVRMPENSDNAQFAGHDEGCLNT